MFYVYVYRDPRPTKDRRPVYVGKGSKNRMNHHWSRGNTGNKPFNDWLTMLRRAKLEPIIEIVAEFEDEFESHLHECSLIDLYGRRDMKAAPIDAAAWSNGLSRNTGKHQKSRTGCARALGLENEGHRRAGRPDYRARTTTRRSARTKT